MCLKKSPELPAKFQPRLDQSPFLKVSLNIFSVLLFKVDFDKYQPISFDLHYSEGVYTVCCPGYVWNDREKRCKR